MTPFTFSWLRAQFYFYASPISLSDGEFTGNYVRPQEILHLLSGIPRLIEIRRTILTSGKSLSIKSDKIVHRNFFQNGYIKFWLKNLPA